MTKRVTVTLPDDVLAMLDAIAGDEGVSRSDVVREASTQYVIGRASGSFASRRLAAVEDGITWLEEVAARHPDAPSSLETLRELRESDGDRFGAPLGTDDDPGIP